MIQTQQQQARLGVYGPPPDIIRPTGWHRGDCDGEGCTRCALVNRLDHAAVTRETYIFAPFNETAYLLDSARCGSDPEFLDLLRPAFLRGKRFLSPDWKLAAQPPDVALIVVDGEDIDTPLGLTGTFTVRGFKEQAFYEETLTPLQCLNLRRRPYHDSALSESEIDTFVAKVTTDDAMPETVSRLKRMLGEDRTGEILTVVAPDWTIVCTPRTTKADLVARASIEYAWLFGDVDGYDPDVMRNHRIVEGITVGRRRRTIEFSMGS